jgi:16S rRNA pseudouridine516 synthase
MRLDKFLAHTTDLTRTLARQVIKQQRVRINGQCADNAAQAVLATDQITLDDELLSLPGNRYIMLNKPSGYVCTREDPHHAHIFSLVSNSDDLHAAGRLDADTTGLVLLTNDGQWSHRVTAPRRNCNKIYCVTLAHELTPDQTRQIEQGIMLNGEDKPTLPAQIECMPQHQIRLTIHEGKYHQVKRMLAAVDNRVTALHRESIGHIKLDDSLQLGEWRELTNEEFQAFE